MCPFQSGHCSCRFIPLSLVLLAGMIARVSELAAAVTSLSMEQIPREVRIAATGQPGSYFILQSSASLEEFQPISIDIAAGVVYWDFDMTGVPGQFWIVRQISLNAPEDTDHDGMDDVWELAQQLDPLSPADAVAIPVGENRTNLQIYLNVWQRKIPNHEVYSQEASVFNMGSAFGSADAVAREVAVYNFGSPPWGMMEVIGHEVSVYNGESPPFTDMGDSVSREVTACNFGSAPGGAIEAIGHEVSVYNGESAPPTDLRETISLETSVFNYGSPSGGIEAISREVTVLNFLDPGPP